MTTLALLHWFRIGKGRPSRGGGHDWMSRDSRHVDCEATGCKFNVAKTCAVPTRCVIKADGGCAGFEAKPLGMNPKQELRELAINLEGMADGIELTGQKGTPIALRLRKSGEWLHKLSGHICRQGYIGCNGGDGCTSDHK